MTRALLLALIAQAAFVLPTVSAYGGAASCSSSSGSAVGVGGGGGASPLHIQPPHGETLVNFDTIYFTDPTAIDKQITLLGATVDFHITAAAYTWHYGDGQAQTTTDPGAAYPHQTITHRYLRKGTATPSLDTTYQADYRINTGTWQHLNQTVTIPGTPQALTIRTATPHLVDSD